AARERALAGRPRAGRDRVGGGARRGAGGGAVNVAVVFDLEGDVASGVRPAALARTLAPAASVRAVCATAGPISPAKARVAALGLERAAVVCHPALSDAGLRSRGTVLAALVRHVAADLVLFGLPVVEDLSGLVPAVVAQAL